MIEDWHPYIPTGNTSQSDDGHDVGSIRFPSSRFGRDVISFCEKGARVPFVPDGKFLLLRERKRWMQRGHGNASDGCLWPSMTMPLRLASNSKSYVVKIEGSGSIESQRIIERNAMQLTTQCIASWNAAKCLALFGH